MVPEKIMSRSRRKVSEPFTRRVASRVSEELIKLKEPLTEVGTEILM